MTAIAIILASIGITLTIISSKGSKKDPTKEPNDSDYPNRWIR